MFDVALISCSNFRRFYCGKFNTGLAHRIRDNRASFQFWKEFHRATAESNAMAVAHNKTVITIQRQKAGVIANERPASPRSRIGQRRFTSAGIAAKQHAMPIRSYACCMQTACAKCADHAEER